MQKRAILFDIDGTLLYARGVGRVAFGEAFKAAYGVEYPALADLSFVGGTDYKILRKMVHECGLVGSVAQEEHFLFCLAQKVDAILAQTAPHVYAGVPELLQLLVERDYVLGLMTGNMRATGWSKVRHAGLDRLFSFGAFGDEHAERNLIARQALTRAPAGCEVVAVIGDTPWDIEAAHANGVKAVAVATGWIEADELERAGADLVLADFSDLSAALQAMEGLWA